jgi:hypothetical protein
MDGENLPAVLLNPVHAQISGVVPYVVVTAFVSSWDICHAMHEEASGASEGLFSMDGFLWWQKVDRHEAFHITKEWRIVWMLVKVCLNETYSKVCIGKHLYSILPV